MHRCTFKTAITLVHNYYSKIFAMGGWGLYVDPKLGSMWIRFHERARSYYSVSDSYGLTELSYSGDLWPAN